MDLESVLTEVQSWPVEARLRLIREVWGGLPHAHEGSEPSEALKALIDQRLGAYEADPDDVLTWDEIKAVVSGRSL